MGYTKKFPGWYPGNMPPGIYDGVHAPGYVRPIDNGLENPPSLAHRSPSRPDFLKRYPL